MRRTQSHKACAAYGRKRTCASARWPTAVKARWTRYFLRVVRDIRRQYPAPAASRQPDLGQAAITLMSDVNNPWGGERGATAIFGPQKGVREKDIAAIDQDVARYAALTEETLGRSASQEPGAGAAGGLGYALQLVGAR